MSIDSIKMIFLCVSHYFYAGMWIEVSFDELFM